MTHAQIRTLVDRVCQTARDGSDHAELSLRERILAEFDRLTREKAQLEAQLAEAKAACNACRQCERTRIANESFRQANEAIRAARSTPPDVPKSENANG